MKIAMIGAGAMGGATVEGLIRVAQKEDSQDRKDLMFKNEDITVSDPSSAVLDKFEKMGVSVTTTSWLPGQPTWCA